MLAGGKGKSGKSNFLVAKLQRILNQYKAITKPAFYIHFINNFYSLHFLKVNSCKHNDIFGWLGALHVPLIAFSIAFCSISETTFALQLE